MTGDAAQISLSGGVLNPELLPTYIQRLGREPAMRGKSFSTLQMQQVKAEPAQQNPDAGNQTAGNQAAGNQTARQAMPRYVEFTLHSTPDSEAKK